MLIINNMMCHVVTLMLAVACFVFAYIVVKGKSDRFISGYSTVSQEEKVKVNVNRMRILLALISVLVGSFCVVVPLLANYDGAIRGAVVILLCFGLAVLVLANAWAVKK